MIVKLSVNGGNGEMLIPQDTAGIEWDEKWSNALSMRASDSHDVHFKNVRVPKDNLIVPRPGKGGPSVWFPIIMSAVYLGAAIAARNATIRFALERVPTALGKPIATLPKIQRQIGEMDMQLQAARSLFLETAGAWAGDSDQAEAFLPRVAAAKLIVTRTANTVTDMALQVAGGQSITHDLPLERYFRDVRAGSMQPPSGDTALEIVGRAAIESSRNGHDA
jgi:alkylation response protein AidB-like acyl-CoA dehydrogenase